MEMTPAEKLILIILSEIYEHLGIKGRDGIDTTFVRSMIERNQTWASDCTESNMRFSRLSQMTASSLSPLKLSHF